uniref:BED-type domain-containing protein n=1 Tax=Anopheles farauti TaxID=69004 RepID=A0A182QNK8_9DIPT
MPNRLTTNAIVWLYFAKDPTDKKAKCLHCSQIINYAKSSYSNLKRHLARKHPFLLDIPNKYGLLQKPDNLVMEHFFEMPNKKAKCMHCGIIMSNNVMSNLRRHMAKKHPTIMLKDRFQSEVVHKVERLYDGTQSPTESMFGSSKASIVSTNDSDMEHDETKHGPIELQPIDSNGLTEPIRIEIVDLNPEPKHEDDEEVIEDTVHQTDPSTHYHRVSGEHRDTKQVEHMSQMIDESMMDNDSSHNSSHFLSIGLKDINVKSAAYATNVALELESLDRRQRIIAEKLISDVLFHAKLENLTEFSMVLVKVDRALCD